MNKDIRNEIYKYLTISEKLDIMEINDKVLNRQIKEEMNETWMVRIRRESFMMKGKNEKDIIWKIFMSEKGIDMIQFINFSLINNEKLEKIFYETDLSDKEGLKKIRDRLLKEIKREVIIKSIDNIYYSLFIEITSLRLYIKIMKGIDWYRLLLNNS